MPLRQCLQCVTAELLLITVSVLTDLFETREDKVELSTLSLGWPSLWCHRSSLLDFLTLKAWLWCECGWSEGEARAWTDLE